MAKKYYTRTLAKDVANNARGEQMVIVHVISKNRNDWAVVRDGRDRSLRIFARKNSAVSYAKTYLKEKNELADIIVHDKAGNIVQAIEVKAQKHFKK